LQADKEVRSARGAEGELLTALISRRLLIQKP